MSDSGPNHRLHYFNNQFLLANDFADEQEYHLYKRRLHNRTLHTPGISEGLDVRIDLKDPKTLTVSKGIAIDRNGNEIVLGSDQQVSLSLPQPNDPATNVLIYVSIAYSEEPPKDAIPEFKKMWQPEDADRKVSNQYTRTIEKAVLKASWSEDKEAIQLAKYNVTLKALDLSVRLRSSAKLSATQDLTTPEANCDQVYPTAKAVKTYVDSKILKSSSVSTEMLANGAITSEKIANGAITQDKLSPSVTVPPSSIGTEELRAEAVTNEKIKNKTITIDKLDFAIPGNPWRGDGNESIYFANDVGIGLNSPPKAVLEIQAAARATSPSGDGGNIRFFDKSGEWMYECAFNGGTDGVFNFVNTGVIGGETSFLALNSKVVDNKVLTIKNNGEIVVNQAVAVKSSRVLKQDISDLSGQEAANALAELNPVHFVYLGDPDKKKMLGFIAEDVPELVAASGGKAIHTLNIVAILTKVVKQQQEEIAQLHSRLSALEENG